jgi:hypothetical protein
LAHGAVCQSYRNWLSVAVRSLLARSGGRFNAHLRVEQIGAAFQAQVDFAADRHQADEVAKLRRALLSGQPMERVNRYITDGELTLATLVSAT